MEDRVVTKRHGAWAILGLHPKKTEEGTGAWEILGS